MATASRTPDSDSDTKVYRKMRTTGLSDDEEGLDSELIAELQMIYYSDEDEPSTDQWMKLPETGPDGDDERHGWVYKIYFSSGFIFRFGVLTSFLIYCNFKNFDEWQSRECYWRDVSSCFWRHGTTAQMQLEYELFNIGATPPKFLDSLRDALPSIKHDMIYI